MDARCCPRAAVLVVLLTGMGAAGDRQAADRPPAASQPAVRAFVELRDGRVVVGALEGETVPFLGQASGPMTVRLDLLKSIEAQPDRETFVLTFRNGDVLRGVFRRGSLRLRTAAGAQEAPLVNLLHLEAFAGDFDHAQGLVAFYPFCGNALDAGDGEWDGVVHGASPTADRFGQPDSAYFFDGTKAYVEVAEFPGGGPGESLTVSAWIKRADDSRDQHIVRQGGRKAGTYRFGLVLFSGADIIFNTNDNARNAWYNAGANAAIKANEWYHVAGVFDAATGALRAYVNGREGNFHTNANITAVTDEPLLIGAEYYHGIKKFFHGAIDDVRVYRRALSRWEVSELYAYETEHGPPPPKRTGPSRRLGYGLDAGSGWAAGNEGGRVAGGLFQGPVRSRTAAAAAIDTLTTLHQARHVPKDVHDAEKAALERIDGPNVSAWDAAHGRAVLLSRLYQAGVLDTATFLAHYAPVLDGALRGRNLLQNGGFESKGMGAPDPRLVGQDQWEPFLAPPPDVSVSRMLIATDVKRSGQQSLQFASTRGPSRLGLRSAAFKCRREDSVLVQFWVKASDLKTGHSGRAAAMHLLLSDESLRPRAILSLDIPCGTYDWMRMQAQVQVPGTSPAGGPEPCRLTFEFTGEGTLWLDDVLVVAIPGEGRPAGT